MTDDKKIVKCPFCSEIFAVEKSFIDQLSFWWMNDNHTFVKLKGKNLSQIIKHAEKARKNSPYGMICPVICLSKGKEIRRVGISCHCHGLRKSKEWKENLIKWVDSLKKDQELMEFLNGMDKC